MEAALLANMDWLEEEGSVFRHLVVGLIDEQIRVAQVIPEDSPPDRVSGFGDRVIWRDSPYRLVRNWRLGRLHEPLGDLSVDVLHGLDGVLWEPAAKLAARLKIPLVLTASAASDVRRLPDVQKHMDLLRVGFAAATKPIGEALREVTGEGATVEITPAGVFVPEEPKPRRDSEQPLCAVISGNGTYDEEYDALLNALPRIIDQNPNAQFFLDGQGADQQKLWSAAGKLNLLSNMSTVPRRLGRELLLSADILIHPQALGRSRSIILQAMAHGLPVLAHEDPWLDFLIDDQTAWLVRDGQTNEWSQLLRRVIDQRTSANALGTRARTWVGEHHQASTYVQRTLGLYKNVTGEALKFPEP